MRRSGLRFQFPNSAGSPSLKEFDLSRWVRCVFLAYVEREGGGGVFGACGLVGSGGVDSVGLVVTVCCSRFSRRSFHLRRHPNPSLRGDTAAFWRQTFGPLGPDTEYSCSTVSPTPGRLNQVHARPKSRVEGLPQAGLAWRGSCLAVACRIDTTAWCWFSLRIVSCFVSQGSRESLPPSPSPRPSLAPLGPR